MSFLEEIADWTSQAVDARKKERSLSTVRAGIRQRSDRRPFLEALQGPSISLIAEFKRSSPSHATVRDVHVPEYVDAYVRGGATALSILTEERSFKGCLGDLRVARERTTLPLLRKDFINDEYQVYEAAEAGADAILLIAAFVGDDGALRGLYSLARELRLDVLFEIRDQTELERGLALEADLIGINNRELQTEPSSPRKFEVDIARTKGLAHEIPAGITVVAESGLSTRDQLDELEARGVHAALIGSALMDAPDPRAKCIELTRRSGAGVNAPEDAQPAFV